MTQPSQSLEAWEASATLMACTNCQSVLLHTDGQHDFCPYCLQPTLTSFDAPHKVAAPEGVLPHQLSSAQIQRQLGAFRSGIPFPPKDLDDEQQLKRLRKLYIPMWWIDVPLQSPWQAEIGLEYEVSSHEENYQNGQWQTVEKRETRLDWETRFGQIDRTFENIPAPALTYFRSLETKLGSFYLDNPQPYEPQHLHQTEVLLPDHTPEDAWSEARYLVETHVKEQCMQAADGVNVRNFAWQPSWGKQNWTHLLLPVYTTFYHDDRGEICPLYIHGQTGKVYGRKQASMKRANSYFQLLMGIALIVLLVAVGLVVWGLKGDAQIAAGVVGGFGAFILLLVGLQAKVGAERFNEAQQSGFLWKQS